MKKFSKKLLALILTAIMVISAVPLTAVTDLGITAKAETSGHEGIYYYSIYEDNGEYYASIYDADSSASGEIIIPEKLGGYPVRTFGTHSFAYNDNITKVVIPDSVLSVSPFAFYCCSSLQDVFLGENVSSLGEGAFGNCESLETINIPAKLSEIDHDAFYNSPNLTITVDSDNEHFLFENGALFNKDKTCLIELIKTAGITEYTVPTSVTSIAGYAFSGCNIEKVNLPYGLERINYCAFYGCSMKSINIPDTVEVIEQYAFSNCTNLENVEFSDSLTTIAYAAFEGCYSLKSVEFPDSLITIESYAFDSCYNLENVTFPEGLTSIGYCAFMNCDSLYSIDLPSSITYIGSSAFGYCESLTDVRIEDGVQLIDNDAFCDSACYYDDDNWIGDFFILDGYLVDYHNDYGVYLTRITIPDGVKYIGNAFEYNYSLESITFPDSVIRINDYAFECCYYLESVTFGKGLKSIGEYAFAYTNIKTLNLPEGLETIGDYAFYSGQIETVNLPSTLKSIGNYAFVYNYNLKKVNIPDNVELGYGVFESCYDLAEITIGKNVKGIASSGIVDTAFYQNSENWEDGVALYFDDVLAKVAPDFVGEFTVKPGTKEIASMAFENCTGLTAVNLPEGLNAIGDSAFAACNGLKEITLPSTCESVGATAFSLCTNLEKVNAPNLKYIDEMAFAGCLKLKELPISSETVEVGEAAFLFCTSVSSVNIPANTEIEPTAFVGCTSVTKYSVDPANKVYTTDANGVLYDRNMQYLVAYPSASAMTSYKVPEGVKSALPIFSPVNLQSMDLPSTFLAEESDLFDAMFLLASVGMKVDVNSLTQVIDKYKDDLINLIFEIDTNLNLSGLNSIIDYVLDYAIETESKEALFEDIDNFCSEIVESAKIANFKGFTVAKDNPILMSKDGALYVCNQEEKALYFVPVTTNGKFKVEEGTTDIFPAAFVLTSPESIILPSSIEEIYTANFVLCSAGSLTIPKTVQAFDEMAFAGSFISTIKFEDRDTLPEAEYGTPFALCFAKEIILPDSVTVIPYQYFYLSFAENIELPKKLLIIEEQAFMLSFFLKSINIPASVMIIEEEAFLGSISLEEVNFPFNSKLEHIGSYAFMATNIKNFKIPAKVSYIGRVAVSPNVGGLIDSYVQLLKLELVEILPELEEELGISINIDKVDLAVDNVVSWFNKKESFEVDSANRNFSVDEYGNLYNYDKTKLISVSENLNETFVIPNSVISIGTDAFACTNVTEIIIPDTVKSFDQDAFEMATNLKSISIGSGIKTISSDSFSNCYNLERVVILPTVVSIDENAFKNCSDNLKIVGYTGSYAYTYALENEIPFETIDGSAFISIIAPTEVATSKVPCYGHTLANTKVEIFDGATKIGEINSGSTGFWRTEVTLNGKTDNSVHKLTAKVFNGTEKEVVSQPVNVTYTVSTPVFESITVYHNNQNKTITYETIFNIPTALTYSSYSPFTYEIELSIYDGSKTIYVVSGDYKLPAVYDARTCKYVASGKFGDHIPEYVTLEMNGCTLANASFRFPFIIDPSGFVYEGVQSNRIEGATASIFFEDKNGLPVLWEDANLYEQNPIIITGADGMFQWDVPAGQWQVKVEKEGYETAYSDWLTVPPPQLDVNIGIISKNTPSVKYANAYSDGIEITFSQYMNIDSVINSNIAVYDEEGNTVYGYWSPVDSEYVGDGTYTEYATTFSFYSYDYLEEECKIIIPNTVANYAGKKMNDPYNKNLSVVSKVYSLNIPESMNLEYGKTYTDGTNVVNIDGGAAAAGKKVIISMSNGYTVTILNAVTLDNEGKATVSISASKPGSVKIDFNLDGTNLTESIDINVSMSSVVRVTGIYISDKTAKLQIGAQKQLSAYVAPEFADVKDVTWSSSNPKVVSVTADGLIKALKDGTATITATTKEGAFTAKCDVTVIAQEYTVSWDIDGKITTQKYKPGAKIVVPKVPEKAGYKFTGWSPAVPETMPTKNLKFTAVYTKINQGIDVKPEPVPINFDIRTPTQTVIKYGDSIDLHADVYVNSVLVGTLSEDYTIVWSSDSENFKKTESANGTVLTITPDKSGDTVFTATLLDAEGNEIGSDTQTMTSKAGFFQKIIAFFKKLFKLTKHFSEFFVVR